jgi:hypothetical protein
MLRFSVTKQCHWTLMLEYVESRLDGVVIAGDGQMVRGGSLQWRHKALTGRDHQIVEALIEENKRGKSARPQPQPSEPRALGADREGPRERLESE